MRDVGTKVDHHRKRGGGGEKGATEEEGEEEEEQYLLVVHEEKKSPHALPPSGVINGSEQHRQNIIADSANVVDPHQLLSTVTEVTESTNSEPSCSDESMDPAAKLSTLDSRLLHYVNKKENVEVVSGGFEQKLDQLSKLHELYASVSSISAKSQSHLEERQLLRELQQGGGVGGGSTYSLGALAAKAAAGRGNQMEPGSTGDLNSLCSEPAKMPEDYYGDLLFGRADSTRSGLAAVGMELLRPGDPNSISLSDLGFFQPESAAAATTKTAEKFPPPSAAHPALNASQASLPLPPPPPPAPREEDKGGVGSAKTNLDRSDSPVLEGIDHELAKYAKLKDLKQAYNNGQGRKGEVAAKHHHVGPSAAAAADTLSPSSPSPPLPSPPPSLLSSHPHQPPFLPPPSGRRDPFPDGASNPENSNAAPPLPLPLLGSTGKPPPPDPPLRSSSSSISYSNLHRRHASGSASTVTSSSTGSSSTGNNNPAAASTSAVAPRRSPGTGQSSCGSDAEEALMVMPQPPLPSSKSSPRRAATAAVLVRHSSSKHHNYNYSRASNASSSDGGGGGGGGGCGAMADPRRTATVGKKHSHQHQRNNSVMTTMMQHHASSPPPPSLPSKGSFDPLGKKIPSGGSTKMSSGSIPPKATPSTLERRRPPPTGGDKGEKGQEQQIKHSEAASCSSSTPCSPSKASSGSKGVPRFSRLLSSATRRISRWVKYSAVISVHIWKNIKITFFSGARSKLEEAKARPLLRRRRPHLLLKRRSLPGKRRLPWPLPRFPIRSDEDRPPSYNSSSNSRIPPALPPSLVWHPEGNPSTQHRLRRQKTPKAPLPPKGLRQGPDSNSKHR